MSDALGFDRVGDAGCHEPGDVRVPERVGRDAFEARYGSDAFDALAGTAVSTHAVAVLISEDGVAIDGASGRQVVPPEGGGAAGAEWDASGAGVGPGAVSVDAREGRVGLEVESGRSPGEADGFGDPAAGVCEQVEEGGAGSCVCRCGRRLRQRRAVDRLVRW